MSTFDIMVRKFNIQKLAKFRLHNYKSLPQLLAPYPGRGFGFRIWQAQWPEGQYYIVQRAVLNSVSHADYYGILYKDGKAMMDLPELIPNSKRRGVWKYCINNMSFKTEEGVEYENWELLQRAKQCQIKGQSNVEKNAQMGEAQMAQDTSQEKAQIIEEKASEAQEKATKQ